jgi:hypothetical protein
MIRWGRITGLCLAVFCLLAPAASAAPLGRAALTRCDPAAGEAVFEGRQSAVRATRMQMRFTLQVGQGRKWRSVAAEGFDSWITVPAGYGKYTYEKTVQSLLPGSNYRAVVAFRWKHAKGGKVVRSERSTSAVCKVPETRPDLVVRTVADDSAGYIARVFNRGRSAAGGFDVSFIVGGVPLGIARVVGLAPGEGIDVFMPGPPCREGEALEAVVDPRSEVDEANEENGSLTASC